MEEKKELREEELDKVVGGAKKGDGTHKEDSVPTDDDIIPPP